MNTVFAIAGVVIKELYRRKDFYVLFILTALITVVMGSVNFFNDEKIVRYLKEITLLLIWISALVIAVVTAARQIPAERESRTIFPLLAKPVTRAQVVLGKFAGCWLASGIALAVFYLFFGAITAMRETNWPAMQFLQAVWQHWMMLGIVNAMVLLGSVVFAAPSSNATISLIVIGGILFLARHLNTVALQLAEPARSLLYTIYYIIPHLEFYDLREMIVHNQGVIPWLAMILAALYAAAYMAVFLIGTWLVFRRKPLN
jgi:ABC-type transport system involved in multi-copper enzyme maturation permease subunit